MTKRSMAAVLVGLLAVLLAACGTRPSMVIPVDQPLPNTGSLPTGPQGGESKASDRGIVLFQDGKYRMAYDLLSQSATGGSGDARTLKYLSMASERLRLRDVAPLRYSEALALAPNDSELQAGLKRVTTFGSYLLHEGDLDGDGKPDLFTGTESAVAVAISTNPNGTLITHVGDFDSIEVSLIDLNIGRPVTRYTVMLGDMVREMLGVYEPRSPRNLWMLLPEVRTPTRLLVDGRKVAVVLPGGVSMQMTYRDDGYFHVSSVSGYPETPSAVADLLATQLESVTMGKTVLEAFAVPGIAVTPFSVFNGAKHQVGATTETAGGATVQLTVTTAKTATDAYMDFVVVDGLWKVRTLHCPLGNGPCRP